ncbi:MAG TPA: Rv1355c family protein [Planctomycetota bacterium]
MNPAPDGVRERPAHRTAVADTTDRTSWQPVLYEAGDDAAFGAVQALAQSGRCQVANTIEAQLGELLETRRPERDYGPEELRHAVAAFLAGVPAERFGTFVHYPWSARLVQVLPCTLYREVRTSRNRNKITTAEQQRLLGLKVAIAGLSVGRATATTLALEGIGTEFRLADFDTLSLSNMNRLRTPVHDLGVNKAVSCARELYEIDPYLTVHLMPRGVRPANLGELLDGVDFLFEECDDMAMKFRLREGARERRLPVLMETSDRGMIDIERFDREPQRPLFHGLVADLRAQNLAGLTTEQKVPIVLRILGASTMSKRFAASLVDVDTTLCTWPQLASAVALGGALNAAAARRIALGQLTQSGRFHADVEDVLVDGGEAFERAPAAAVTPAEPAPLPSLPALAATSLPLTTDAVRVLVAYAAAAPSGGNCQPWSFTFSKDVLRCRHDATRSRSLLDHGHRASHLALGAAAENVAIAARAMGLTATLCVFPEPDVAWSATFAPAAAATDVEREAAAWIGRRCTNRRLGERRPLPEAAAEALHALARAAGSELRLLDAAEELDAIAGVLAAGDRLRFLSPTLHRELYAELRWPGQDAHTGLDVRTLELTAGDLEGVRLTGDTVLVRQLREIEAGQGLGRMARRAIAASSAVGVLTCPGHDAAAYVHAGRTLQRVWLAANRHGLALQPWTPLLYLFNRLAEGAVGLDAWEVAELRTLHTGYRQLVAERHGASDVMLFRLAVAEPPTARSLRLPVDAVLHFA